MAKDEFFEEKAQEAPKEEAPETEAPEKIKVGDDEYSQDELDRLISLGKIGVEAEEKYKTKIDRVWPEYTKSRQELKELKESMEKAEIEKVEKTGEPLTDEQMKKQVQAEARKHGLLTREDATQFVTDLLKGRDLLEDVGLAVGEAQEKYGIKTDKESLLEHMRETGIRNPEKALKDMFEEQIDKWKEKELGKKKGSGLVTEKTSTAGGKTPKETKPTKETLSKHISEALYSKGE